MIKRVLCLIITITMLTVCIFSALSFCSINNDVYKNVNDYNSLSDNNLLKYVEDSIYERVIKELDSDKYFIENVKTTFISKEYIDELEYNSKKNIFFGYTLKELDEQFQGKKYYFTVDDKGETVVKEVESIVNDDTTSQIVKNVAIGTGVILICVTVSFVTAGAGAPAASMIFAASAKTGATFALSQGLIAGAASGIIKGLESGDMNQAINTGLIAASEGFKWGAISGAVVGGAGKAAALHGATLNGLTMNQAAQIQKESGYPLDVIKQFKSMEQYEICKASGLQSQMINDKIALVRNVDFNFIDDKGRTNLQRMQKGLAPIESKTGQAFELHHIGQRMNSSLAVLTKSEHMQNGNNSIWHILGKSTEISREVFADERISFWKAFALKFGG